MNDAAEFDQERAVDRGLGAFLRQEPSEALRSVDSANEVWRLPEYFAFAKAQIVFYSGDLAGGLMWARRAREHSPESPLVSALWANLTAKPGGRREPVIALAARFPDLAYLQYVLGSAALIEGDADEALTRAGAADAIVADCPPFLLLQALALKATGNLDQAARVAEHLSRSCPTHGEWQRKALPLLYSTGERKLARDLARTTAQPSGIRWLGARLPLFAMDRRHKTLSIFTLYALVAALAAVNWFSGLPGFGLLALGAYSALGLAMILDWGSGRWAATRRLSAFRRALREVSTS